ARAVGLVAGLTGPAKAVAVHPNFVAVIDPDTNSVAEDIPVGGYPLALAADSTYVYASNFGDGTISRIRAAKRRYADTSGYARALDMAVINGDVWSANGGSPGHTPTAPPGTIMDYDFTAARLVVPVGPDLDGPEEETTIAVDPTGAGVWAGNQYSATVTLIDASGARVTNIRGIPPGGLATTGDASVGTTLWASDPLRDVVVRIDGEPKRVVARIHVRGGPTRVAADDHGVWIIARDVPYGAEWRPTRETNPAGWRIDPQTNRVVERIPLPLTPMRITLGKGSVWVTAQRVLSARGATVDATVFRIDARSGEIVGRIPLRTPAVDGIVFSHGRIWAAVPPSQ